MSELSVMQQHLILPLGFLECEILNQLANRNGKFGDLLTEFLSGLWHTPIPHYRYRSRESPPAMVINEFA